MPGVGCLSGLGVRICIVVPLTKAQLLELIWFSFCLHTFLKLTPNNLIILTQWADFSGNKKYVG